MLCELYLFCKSLAIELLMFFNTLLLFSLILRVTPSNLYNKGAKCENIGYLEPLIIVVPSKTALKHLLDPQWYSILHFLVAKNE